MVEFESGAILFEEDLWTNATLTNLTLTRLNSA
jgi:hypothetical protein